MTRSLNPLTAAAVAALDALRTTSIFGDVSQDSVTKSRVDELYLHRALVDQHAIELDECVIGATWFGEDDGCNAAAYAVGSVCEHSSSYGAN